MQSATTLPPGWDVAKILTATSLVCGFIGVGIKSYTVHHRQKTWPPLDSMIGTFYTAAMIPVGFFLILCAFDPTLTAHLNSFNFVLAAAGITTIYVGVKGLFG